MSDHLYSVTIFPHEFPWLFVSAFLFDILLASADLKRLPMWLDANALYSAIAYWTWQANCAILSMQNMSSIEVQIRQISIDVGMLYKFPGLLSQASEHNQ